MIRLSQKAKEKIKDYAKSKQEYSDKSLRIFVQGLSCSGYTYGFSFDDQKEEDTLIEDDGVRIIIDAKSLKLMQGSYIDFLVQDDIEGFTVDNPNLKNKSGSCCDNSESKGDSCSGGACC